MATRRRWTPWILVVAFVAMPILEIYVLIQVGQVVGALWTVLLLLLGSIIGGWVIRREGGRAFTALRSALNAGRMPARELADGGLILIGGTLMLSPGFVTDAMGILLILPVTRPVFRRLLTTVVARRLVAVPGAPGFSTGFGPGFGAGGPAGGPGAGPGTTKRPGPGSGGSVVRGEVVDEE